MSFTTQEAFLEELERYISTYSWGSDNAPIGLTFFAANYVVQTKDVQVLDKLPDWLAASVRDLGDVYQRDGELILYTSNGSSNKSEMGKELLELLKGS